jgi:hypothetical protein
MTDFITAMGVTVLGGFAVFFFMTLLRVLKSGPTIADVVLRSGFDASAWWNGTLPQQGRGSTIADAAGIRAKVGRKGSKIVSTRTLSREVL